MSKVLVLYYSSYGHIEAMANAVAEGARQTGAHVDIKRVPELVPEEIARKSHYKLDQAAPVAKIEDLAAYDAIIVGAGTRFGRLPSRQTREEPPRRNSLDPVATRPPPPRASNRGRTTASTAGFPAAGNAHQTVQSTCTLPQSGIGHEGRWPLPP